MDNKILAAILVLMLALFSAMTIGCNGADMCQARYRASGGSRLSPVIT